MAIERYRAQRGAEIPHAVAAAAARGYTIEVHFLGGLTAKQKAAFKLAANRWTHAIVGDLPDVTVGGERINNLRITAQGTDIDGPGNVLGQAGPDRLRPKSAGAAAFLPATGDMQFDVLQCPGISDNTQRKTCYAGRRLPSDNAKQGSVHVGAGADFQQNISGSVRQNNQDKHREAD